MEVNGKKVDWSKEFIFTWTKYKSLLSSKKIIQNTSYTFGSIILLTYHFAKISCWKICEGYTATDAGILAGVFFSIGGYTTHKIYQEKRAEIQDKEVTS